jgi:hypothetical protein
MTVGEGVGVCVPFFFSVDYPAGVAKEKGPNPKGFGPFFVLIMSVA